MATENPKGEQAKKRSPTTQTTSPANQPNQPRPKDATGPNGAQKQGQTDGASRQPAKQGQGKPTPDQGARNNANRPPRPTTGAPKPASMAKPGSTPAGSDPARSERRIPDSRPGEPRRDAQGGGGRGNFPSGRDSHEQNGGDEIFNQRVFDPDATDTVPGRGGRLLGPAASGANRGRGRGPGTSPAPRPPTGRPMGSEQRPADSSEQRRPSNDQQRRSQPQPQSRQPNRPSGNGHAHPKHPQPVAKPRPGEGAPALGTKTSPTPGRVTPAPAAPVTEIIIPASLTVRELAEKMRHSPIEVIKTLMNYGMMVPITAPIDFDTAQLIGEELGIAVKPEKAPEPVVEEVKEEAPKTLRQKIMAAEKEADLVLRPPVVTVLGHVDHGKTTLLDAIREARVVEGEAGGITQHIGAYQAERDGRKITFLDTPGHEAFTAMRARGAQVTDIAVLVVAADDGVMPQTKEAIAHAKAAQVPIVVALNKIDKPTANPERVKQELADNGVLIEEYGGDVVCVPVSAKMRRGIGDLLENILLVADIDPLRANPNGDCVGTVVESRLDKSRGPMATLLVQNGTLHVGDSIVTGETYAKIRAMYDDKGEPITEALPSTPVAILGLADVPVAGDTFQVVADERAARAVANERIEKRRAAVTTPASAPRTLEGFFAAAEAGQVKELNLILKADVQGSIEPIVNSLEKLGDEKLKVKILQQATGNITESDVMLAIASKAIILGFSVVVDAAAQRMADAEGVDIRIYNIIYKLIEDVDKALKGMLEPVYKEVTTGHAEIRQVFRITKVGKVDGCMVTDGELTRNAMARIKRDDQVLREDKIVSLKRFQEDVTEVKAGFECGLNFGNFTDFEIGDMIEAYRKERVN